MHTFQIYFWFGTTIWMHQLDSNETHGEKSRSELHQNAISCFKQIFEATFHRPVAVRPLASHLINQIRHAGYFWTSKDELISDGLLRIPTGGHASIGRLARTYFHFQFYHLNFTEYFSTYKVLNTYKFLLHSFILSSLCLFVCLSLSLSHTHSYAYIHIYESSRAAITDFPDFLFLSIHPSLFSIVPCRASKLHPVSAPCYCRYVLACQPALSHTCVGVHRRTSLMSSSLFLQQSLTCLVRLNGFSDGK